MTKKISELSVFFPFWNESKNIDEVVTSAVSVLNTVADKWELLMIDDGSTDDTLKKALALEKKYKNLRTIALKPNRGYGAALRTGLESARYKYVVFTDGDRQFDFNEVDRFIDKIEKADIVIGFREKRVDSFFRHILMTLLKIWDYIFFRFYFKDIDCGFKMFRKDAIYKIQPLRSEGAMITTEILAKANTKKLRIIEVGVTHLPRKYGEQSGGNISVIVRAMLETFILYWDIKNQRF